jgi:hypothetical protein
MYAKFDIIDIRTNPYEKKIDIEFTQDLDETTVSAKNLILADKENRIVNCHYAANNKILTITFVDWPIPNYEYMFIAQPGISSVAGKKLESTIKRHIIFKSEILAQVKILSPVDYEALTEISVKWQEISDQDFVDEYYLELGDTNAFNNVIIKTTIYNKQEIVLQNIPSGQYFLRIRAQKNNDYGRWSETVTFVLNNAIEINEEISQQEDDPVVIREPEILAYPENGTTPSSFVIEFDDDLEEEEKIEIIIYRKNV